MPQIDMNRRFRLTRSHDFNRVKRDGKTITSRFFKVILSPNQTEGTRFGIITGKSIGNAVIRNRCKRLMRASIQQTHDSFQPGWDVVIIARQEAGKADFNTTHAALMDLFKRSGLFRNENDPTSKR